MNRQAVLLWCDRVIAMTIKELKQLLRDPVLLLIIGYFFTADVYIAGSGINLNLRHASLMVIDRDHSAASRELIYRFRQPYFDLQGEIFAKNSAEDLLNKGQILAVLDIPENFQSLLMQGHPVAVQFQVDTSNTVLGTLATSYATEITAGFGQDFVLKRLGLNTEQMTALPIIENRHRVLYNPNQVDGWFMSVSELLTVTTMLSMMLEDALSILGCSVIKASRVPEGTALANSSEADIAVLDVNVAGQHVYPVAAALRRRGIPFIFVTAYVRDGIPPDYASEPLLHKPFRLAELEGLLRRTVKPVPAR